LQSAVECAVWRGAAGGDVFGARAANAGPGELGPRGVEQRTARSRISWAGHGRATFLTRRSQIASRSAVARASGLWRSGPFGGAFALLDVFDVSAHLLHVELAHFADQLLERGGGNRAGP